jgi:hypothetical protein
MGYNFVLKSLKLRMGLCVISLVLLWCVLCMYGLNHTVDVPVTICSVRNIVDMR